MTRSTMTKGARLGAAAVFFGGAAFEIARIAAGSPWTNLVPASSPSSS